MSASAPQSFPPPSADQPKSAFRAWARGRLKALDHGSEQALSAQASAHGARLLDGHPAGILLTFVPIRGEIDPIMLLTSAIARNWSIAVPRCMHKTGVPQLQALPPAAITPTPDGPRWNLNEFEEDAWGMMAPKAPVPVRPANVTVVLVPGLVFDDRGHRLGRGAGIYDRLLASLPPNALRIGLVYADRVVPRLPHEAHDVPMNAIVTPDGILKPGAN